MDANEVKIKVAADTTAADLSKAKKESKGLADQVERDAQSMRAASLRVAQARNDEATAVGKVRTAQMAYTEAVEKGTKQGSALAEVEERLAKAKRDSALASEKTAAADEQAARAAAKLQQAQAAAAAEMAKGGAGPAVAGKTTATKIPVEVEDRTEGPLRTIGGNIKTWAAGLGVGALIGDALVEGLNKTNLTAHFQNQMGASETVARQAGKVSGEVFAKGFTTEQGMVSDAISSLSSDVQDWGNLTEATQTRIADGTVRIGATFKRDVGDVIRAESSMVNSGMVSDFETAADLITTGFQNVGARGDDLLETLQEYSPYFHNLGMDGADALGLISQMMKAGARDTDYAADSIKEFNVRAIDGTEGTAAAFEKLGFNAEAMAQKIAKGGPEARDAFIQVINGLKNMKSGYDQNIVGVGLFGTQWEDTMRQVIGSLDTGKMKLTGFVGATQKLQAELTPKEQIGVAWDNLTNGIAAGMTDASNSVRRFFGMDAPEPEWYKKAMAQVDKLKGTTEGSGEAFKRVGDFLKPYAYDLRETGAASQFTDDKTRDLTQSVQGLGEAVLGMANKDLAYRQSLASTKDAQDQLVDALKKHKQGSEEVTNASMSLESAQLREIESASELAKSRSKATDEAGRMRDGTQAAAREVVNLAQAANGQLTPALYNVIAGMDRASLAAVGVQITTNKAGEAVYRLPNGKEIKMTADDQASRKATDVSNYIQNLPPIKWITLHVKSIYDTSMGSAYNIPGGMSAGRNAAGGPASSVHAAAAGGARTGPIDVSERGRLETAIMPDRSIVSLPDARVSMPTGTQVMPASGNQGMPAAGGAVDVRISWAGVNDPLIKEIVRQLRVEVQRNGGGEQGAQRLLGTRS